MSGSVENNNSHIIGGQSAVLPVSSAVDENSVEGVAIGYSSESSSEVVEATPASETEDPNLDQPEVSAFSQSEASSLEVLSSNQQLAGLKEVVSYFNEQFDIDALDMADTASVLLFIKGMVSDMKALNNAENVDSALNELLTQYDSHIGIAKSIAGQSDEADNIQSEINEVEIELQIDSAKLAERKLSRAHYRQVITDIQNTLDEGGLSHADKTGFEADIIVYESVISYHNIQIDQLESSISDLESNISNLKSDVNSVLEDIAQLGVRLQVELTSSLGRLFSINEGNRERYDLSAVKTGEEQRAAIAMINVDDDKEHLARKQQFRSEKKVLYEQGNEQVENQIQQEKEIEAARFLSPVLSDTGIDEPEEIVALLDTVDLDEVKSLQDGKDFLMPDKKQLIETARVFEAIVKAIDNKKESDETFDIRPEVTTAESVLEMLLDRARVMNDASEPLDVAISPQQNTPFNVNDVVVPQISTATESEKLDVKTDQAQDIPVENEETNEPVTIKPSILVLDSMIEMLRKMEARRLESEALNFVIEAEKERLEMEQAISKNTPI